MLVSEGFTNVLPVQVNDQIATCNGGACGNQPRPRPDPIGGGNSPAEQRMASQEFFLQAEMMSDIKMVTDLANRYNCAIYSLDPRGLAPFEFDLSSAGQAAVSLTKNQQMLDTTMDTLRVLADETDGRAIVNSNDLDRGLRQIIRDTSAYYLLGYTSAVTTDGKFHKLNVRVKRSGPAGALAPRLYGDERDRSGACPRAEETGTASSHHRGAGHARRQRAAAA